MEKKFEVDYEIIHLCHDTVHKRDINYHRYKYEESQLIGFFEFLRNNEPNTHDNRIVIDVNFNIFTNTRCYLVDVCINALNIKSRNIFSLYIKHHLFKILYEMGIFKFNSYSGNDIDTFLVELIKSGQKEYINYNNRDMSLGRVYGYLNLNVDSGIEFIMNEIKLIELTEV